MNITGTSQRTLDRLNRMEQLLRDAGIKTDYGFNEQGSVVVLNWERVRNGCVIERGHLFAVMSDRTGNLRFCGGGVSAYGKYDEIRTYRDAWNAISLATEMARRVAAMAW